MSSFFVLKYYELPKKLDFRIFSRHIVGFVKNMTNNSNELNFVNIVAIKEKRTKV